MIKIATIQRYIESCDRIINNSKDPNEAKELEKAKENEAKDAENFEKQVKRLEYQRKIQQMDMETMIKIRERQQYIKDNYKKSSDGLTGN